MKTNFKIYQEINRKNAVKAGFYDGRFKSRIIIDKKKNEHRKLRKNKNIE